jgi:hypothetical protein
MLGLKCTPYQFISWTPRICGRSLSCSGPWITLTISSFNVIAKKLISLNFNLATPLQQRLGTCRCPSPLPLHRVRWLANSLVRQRERFIALFLLCLACGVGERRAEFFIFLKICLNFFLFDRLFCNLLVLDSRLFGLVVMQTFRLDLFLFGYDRRYLNDFRFDLFFLFFFFSDDGVNNFFL